ncbi:MAG TPA: type II secretion system secretin GspD [Steroidobacteraceae bacterium]|jgi:general secretion pathway protein D|nr:type II secretion system secretin GspD [Steroidobacteraceae bacterium]
MPDRSTAARARAPRRRSALAAALLLTGTLALLAAGMPASAQNSTQRITPNFTNVDITQIIQAVSMATGKNFIIDPRVRAQVTMLSSTPMTPAEFYQAFLAILQVHGFVAIPDGDVVKIIPDANMRQYPSVDLPEHVSSTSDELVTQVLAIKNVSAAQLVPVLRPLMPQNAQLSAVTGANILIISDHANNVSRMMRIIDRIDQVGNPDFDVMTLQSATADDTARVLNSLMSQSSGGANVKIVADDRSNSIIVSGDAATRLRVKALIAQLDTPVETGTATQVRYLRYADAEDLSTRLKEQMSSNRTGAGGTGARQFNVQPLPNAQGTTTPAGGRQTGADTQAGPATISLAGGQATIWADKDTNSLVMTADAHTMRALNAVIDKLDIRRPQVLVQAIIADVAVDKTEDLGINWAVDGSATKLGIGGFISPVAGSSIIDLYNDVTNPSTALTSNPPTGTTLGIGKLSAAGTNFALMLRALQGDSRTNIIATPSVVTRDNQEAKMEVAEEVPFLTGQYSTTNGTGSAFQTIQQEDVGTLLTVTPTISAGDVVLLKLDVESSSLSSSASGVAGDPITNKNTITTSVLIKDGGTLVLGGLIQDTVTNTQQSVPLLGNIPLLGELFRTRNNEKTKSDFLIFLQPRILRDDEQATIETDSKYSYMRNEQRQVGHDKAILPLAPYEPADPLPPLINGNIGGMFSPSPNLGAPAAAGSSASPAGPAAAGAAGGAKTSGAPGNDATSSPAAGTAGGAP